MYSIEAKKYFPRNDATVTGVVEKAEKGEMDWKTCLETIFKMEQLQCAFEQETYGRIHLILIRNINHENKTFKKVCTESPSRTRMSASSLTSARR